jgi:predicted Zn-dependent protease
VELFESCGLAPNYAPFYAARAELLRSSAKEKSLADLEKAAQLDGRQWRYGKLLAGYYIEANRLDEALAIAQRYYERARENYLLGMLYAKTLLLNKKYLECHELLSTMKVLPYEGATDGRTLYRETQLMLALATMKSGEFDQSLHFIKAAKEWPEDLGSGKPYPDDVDERIEDWLEAVCYEKLEKQSEAGAAWQRVVPRKQRPNVIGDLVSALALEKLGRRSEGEALLNRWVTRRPDSLLARWSLAVFNRRQAELAEPEGMDMGFRIVNEWIKFNGR